MTKPAKHRDRNPHKICDGCQGGPAWQDHARNNGRLTKHDGDHLCYDCLQVIDTFDPKNKYVMHHAADQALQSSWMPESIQQAPKNQFLNTEDKQKLADKMREMGLIKTPTERNDARWYRREEEAEA